MNKSFLKWAGGKSSLLPLLKKIFQQYPSTRLVEPFLGSGVISLNCEFDSYLVNDINPDIQNLWNHLSDELIEQTQLLFAMSSEADYYELRKRFNQLPYGFERACLFIYLNRYCFNGLCRYNSKGGFNVPFGRYKKVYFPETELKYCTSVASKLNVQCKDFKDIFQQVQADDVVYCDPPYYPISPTASFTNYSGLGFNLKEQEELAQCCEDARAKGAIVIVSNSDCEHTRRLYSSATLIEEVQVNRLISANGNRNKANEIIAIFEPM